jgi:predicted DNA-binding transcriptional regulator AlpA
MSRSKKREYPMVEPLLANASQVAGMLKVSKTTLWRLRATGRLPRPVRIGGSIRWIIADLRAWIEDGCSDLRELTRNPSRPTRDFSVR